MSRMLVAAVGVVAIALLYPETSRAGQLGSHSGNVTFEGFVEGVSSNWTDGSAAVDCPSEFQCQIEAPEAPGTHQPVIRFVIITPQVVHVVAGLWDLLTCPTKTPDLVIEGDVDFSMVEPGSMVGIRIIFGDPPPDGTTFSMDWNIDTCPVSMCHDYILGDPTNQC